MPTVIATAGAADANSYITVAEAQSYLDARPNVAAWTAASTENRERAVITATRYLDRLPWSGSRTTAAQALAWPRTAVNDPDAPYGFQGVRSVGYVYIDQSLVPRRVKDATCELALEILNSGATDLVTLDADAGLTSKTVGPLSKTWGARGKPQGLARFPFLSALLGPLLGGSGVVRA